MNRLTQHSKTTMFTDSDVMVEGQRLGPAAFAGLSYYRHYVKIINRLAKLEDRFCNEPQTRADQIRAMTDDELAAYMATREAAMADVIFGIAERVLMEQRGIKITFTDHFKPDLVEIKREYLEMLRQEVEA